MVHGNYIGGDWVEAQSGKRFVNVNPATGEAIGEFPLSGKEDAHRAIESAKRSFPSWSKVPVPVRGAIMARFADLIAARKEEVARLVTEEMGKVLRESRGDVQECTDTAHFAIGESRRLYGRTVPSELPDKLCLTVRKPIGVAALITPWNFPAALPCWKIIPALLSGNTVVFKPSRETPATATKLVELLIEAGVPADVINLVHGPGEVVGNALCTHPDIGVISFTGSVAVGKKVGATGGKLLKKVSLELGGKNGQIVMDDADMDLALDGALWGAFGTTGQRCTATSRLILHEAIHDEFVSRLVDRANNLKIGNGLDETVEIGPLVSEAQRQRVHGYVEVGKQEGAELACGGGPYTGGECERGFFYRPTIFTNVTAAMRIAREEIFGPVLAVLKVANLDEAIEVINDSQYGLSSAIYTRDVNGAMRAVEEIEAGVVYVNSATIGAECHLPFGGVKASGNGHREGGWAAYDVFTGEHIVYVDYSGRLQKAQMDTWGPT
jgi:acyl-CoA reductase-like NAD-dependent aldehyde dehydrogenase